MSEPQTEHSFVSYAGVIETAAWQRKKITARRCAGLVTWWVMCVVFPPLAIVANVIVGTILGFGRGLIKGVLDSYTELHRWWEQFEQMED